MRPSSPDKPQKTDFLVSFLVDARGGSMTGARRSGVRVVIPPQAAEQPVRLTIRQLRPEQVITLPPLSEGEGLAARILQLTPATFLGPVLVEVPHFAALADNREIVVLRSDTGRRWSVHTNTAATDNQGLAAFLASSITNLNTTNNNDNSSAVTTITTATLPHFFAVVSRPRQEVHSVGAEGGDIVSQVSGSVQVHFPGRALTKEISVGLSVAEVCGAGAGAELARQGGALSPVVTLEPRRRKFHRPVTVTMPLPGPATNTASIETSLLLLCSMSGAGTRSVWEDVTATTPLATTATTATFSSLVSAQFWLLRLPAWMAVDKIPIADNIFRLASRTPYLAHLALFWRHVDSEDGAEMEVRLVVATEGERGAGDTNLEEKESFVKLHNSDKLQILDKSEISVRVTGNLEPAPGPGQEGGGGARLVFRPFVENRVTVALRRREQDSPPVGKLEVVTDCEAQLHSMALSLKPRKTTL